MGHLNLIIIHSHLKQPLFWLRYIDGILTPCHRYESSFYDSIDRTNPCPVSHNIHLSLFKGILRYPKRRRLSWGQLASKKRLHEYQQETVTITIPRQPPSQTTHTQSEQYPAKTNFSDYGKKAPPIRYPQRYTAAPFGKYLWAVHIRNL